MRRFVVLAIGVVALAACTADQPATSPTATAPAVDPAVGVGEGAPVATSAWVPGSDANQALLEGTLALIDGCVYVVNHWDGGEARTLAVFPAALVSWDAATQTLTYAGTPYAMGDRIAAGGGWHPPRADDVIPDSCEPDEYGDVMHIQDDNLEPMAQEGY